MTLKKNGFRLLLLIPLFGAMMMARGPGSGSVAVNNEPQMVYACVINNSTYTVGAENPKTGLFVLTNGKDEWTHLGWKNGRPFGMAIDRSTEPAKIYLASGNGVHKSTDAGKTWVIKTGWEVTEVQRISIHPKDARILFIATPYGVWKSTDAGETWTNKSKGLKEVDQTFVSSVVLDRTNVNRVLIGTEDGVFESRNGGDSWARSGLKGKGVRTMVESPSKPSLVLAGTEDDGVFISTDGGKNWHAVNQGLNHKTIYALSVDPVNPNVFYAGGFHSGMYKSTDAGKSWKNLSDGLTTLDVHAIAVSPRDPKVVYVGTIGGGVFRSDSGGGNWKFVGLSSCFVWDLKIN